jgi:chorismate synthase
MHESSLEGYYMCAANSFGRTFQISLFGESHGPGIGVLIQGCPAGISFPKSFIQNELDRRRPGQSTLTTPRSEPDQFEIVSGVANDTTTGGPICLIIKNTNTKSEDYHQFKKIPRPSQIDYPAMLRYGPGVDLRGSGFFSGRISAGIVMAGALAKQMLIQKGVKIGAYVSQIGAIVDPKKYSVEDILANVEKTPIRAIDPDLASKMIEEIERVKAMHDSIGGIVSVRIENYPAGIGDPWFHSLESDLAGAMLSIPATRGIEFGTGFRAAQMQGSEHNDPYLYEDGKITTRFNHSGGIVGGISLGTPIEFRVPIKPTASIGLPQETLDLESHTLSTLEIHGRHDPCIVPRITVVIEAMTAIVLLDQMMSNQSTKWI